MKSENTEQMKPSATPNQPAPGPALGTMLEPHESAPGRTPAGAQSGLGHVLSAQISGCDSLTGPLEIKEAFNLHVIPP